MSGNVSRCQCGCWVENEKTDVEVETVPSELYVYSLDGTVHIFKDCGFEVDRDFHDGVFVSDENDDIIGYFPNDEVRGVVIRK